MTPGEEETNTLPLMTMWSSMVIDAVIRGDSISLLMPYRAWEERWIAEHGSLEFLDMMDLWNEESRKNKV